MKWHKHLKNNYLTISQISEVRYRRDWHRCIAMHAVNFFNQNFISLAQLQSRTHTNQS
jgi:hypothetical protein